MEDIDLYRFAVQESTEFGVWISPGLLLGKAELDGTAQASTLAISTRMKY